MTDKPESQLPESDYRTIIEALIFAAEEPLPMQRIAEVIGETTGERAPSVEDIEAYVDDLNAHYDTTGRPFQIREWAEGYRMSTRQEYGPFLKRMFHMQRTKKLSRSLMETLAILAYKQPVTKPEIDFIRGVDSDYALRRLMEIDLVDIAGRSDGVGRPLLYKTTDAFMDKFGLRALDDLPTLREVEEILDDPRFNSVKAQLLTAQSFLALDEGAVTRAGDADDRVEGRAATETAAAGEIDPGHGADERASASGGIGNTTELDSTVPTREKQHFATNGHSEETRNG